MKVNIYQKIFLCVQILISLNCVTKAENSDPVTLRSTSTHLLYSEQQHQYYLIDVFLPKDYQAKETEFQFPKYPVIYVLNSRPNAVMAATLRHTAEMTREIIVGIDFADKDGNPIESFSGYTRDLTPTSDSDWMQASSAGSGGQAEEFLNFINNKVKPLINDTYNVNKNNQTLVGHSFGALFGLYVLFNHSNSFDRYVIASPSLWWDDAVTFKFEEKYASQNKNMAKKVFISVGSKEFLSGSQGMIENTDKLVKKIISRKYSDLQIQSRIFEGETHLSVVGLSIHEGLKSVFH
ncbi:MAG: alpha/beta hydrolase [Ignavibacteriae bacterium]|nr:alpha/beta hydrolase [Ignavibacteriota bacterium]